MDEWGLGSGNLPKPFVLVRSHLAQRPDEQDSREQVLADERDTLPARRRTGFTGACAERLPVHALEADKVGMPFAAVRHFVQVRLIAADTHLLFSDALGCFGELLAALNLNHGVGSLLLFKYLLADKDYSIPL